MKRIRISFVSKRTGSAVFPALLFMLMALYPSCSSLIPLVEKGNMPGLKAGIEDGADPNATGSRGDSPLLTAVCLGKKDMAEYLIAAGADPNIVNDDNKTALDYALADRNLPLAEMLLDNGACANSGMLQNCIEIKSLWPLIPRLAENGAALDFLYEQSTDHKWLKFTDYSSNANKKDKYLLQYLLLAGVDVSRPDEFGTNSLHWAIANEPQSLVEISKGEKGAEFRFNRNNFDMMLAIVENTDYRKQSRNPTEMKANKDLDISAGRSSSVNAFIQFYVKTDSDIRVGSFTTIMSPYIDDLIKKQIVNSIMNNAHYCDKLSASAVSSKYSELKSQYNVDSVFTSMKSTIVEKVDKIVELKNEDRTLREGSTPSDMILFSAKMIKRALSVSVVEIDGEYYEIDEKVVNEAVMNYALYNTILLRLMDYNYKYYKENNGNESDRGALIKQLNEAARRIDKPIVIPKSSKEKILKRNGMGGN